MKASLADVRTMRALEALVEQFPEIVKALETIDRLERKVDVFIARLDCVIEEVKSGANKDDS